MGRSYLALVALAADLAFGAAPGAFSLLAPTNNSTDVDIYPEMSWNASSGAERYVLRIGRNALFTAGSYVDVPCDSISCWPVPDLLKGSVIYHWKVAALGSNGSGGYDTTWNTGGKSQFQTIPTTSPSRINSVLPVARNRTLTRANSPYSVRGQVNVGAKAFLTIPDSMTVLFGDGAGFQVNGGFLARGSEGRRITFDYDTSDHADTVWGAISLLSGSVPTTFNAMGGYSSGSSIAWLDMRKGGSFSTQAILMVENVTIRKSGGFQDYTGKSIISASEFVGNTGWGVSGGRQLTDLRIDSNSSGGWYNGVGSASLPTTVTDVSITGNGGRGVSFASKGFLDLNNLTVAGNNGTGISISNDSGATLQDVDIEWHTSHATERPLYCDGSSTNNYACCMDSLRLYGSGGTDWGTWDVHTGTCMYYGYPNEPLGMVLRFSGADTFTTVPLPGAPWRPYTFRFAAKGTGNPRFEWQDRDSVWHVIRAFPDTSFTASYGTMSYSTTYNISGKPERFRIITTSTSTSLLLNWFRFEVASTGSGSGGLEITSTATTASPVALQRVTVGNTTAPGLKTSGKITLVADSVSIFNSDSNGVEWLGSGQKTLSRFYVSGHKKAGFRFYGSDSVSLLNSTFSNNRSSGVRIEAVGSLVFDSSQVRNNSAAQGGGIYVATTVGAALPAKVHVWNTLIYGNTVTSDGGGIYVDTNAAVDLQSLVVQKNVAATYGGGMRSRSLQASVSGLVFLEDSAGNYGGGAYIPLAPMNSVFRSNAAYYGAGAYIYRPVARIAGNTFADNHGTSTSSPGVALYLSQPATKVEWNLFNENWNGNSVLYGHVDTLRQNNLDRNPSIPQVYSNTNATNVEGTYNWWGTRSDQIAIEGFIYHKVDLASLGLVTYQPFLGDPSDSVPGAVQDVAGLFFRSDSLYASSATLVHAGDTVYLELKGTDTNPYSRDPVVVEIMNMETWESVSPILIETTVNSGVYRGVAYVSGPTNLATNHLAASDGDSLYLYWTKNPDIGTGIRLGQAAANHAPVTVADSYTVAEDNSLTVAAAGVLSNDTDVDGNPLTAVKVSDPAHGTLTLNSNGSFTYVPSANYNGSDAFTYKANDGMADGNVVTVSLTVTAANDAPIAVADNYTVAEDNTLTIMAAGVLSNDTDVEGDVLTAVKVTDPVHGSVTFNANGSFLYTPDANYSGSDSFTYKANDGTVSGNTVTVSITVTPVNDSPVTVADSYTVAEDNTLTVAASGVLTNDTDVDGNPLSAVKVSDPAHGTLTLNSNGSFTYVPGANYNGSDSFTYKSNDGVADGNTVTVSLTITAVNDAPVAVADNYTVVEDNTLTVAAAGVLSNDTDVDGSVLTAVKVTDPAHGTLTLNSDGSFTYVPNADYSGSDSFTYKANDGTVSGNTVTVSITVSAVNDAPEFTMTLPDTLLTSADPFIVSLQATDPDGDVLHYSVLLDPGAQSFDLGTTGSWNWTPNTDNGTSLSATAIVSDGILSDTLQFQITLDIPVAMAASSIHNAGILAVSSQWAEVRIPSGGAVLRLIGLDGRVVWSVNVSASETVQRIALPERSGTACLLQLRAPGVSESRLLAPAE